MEVYLVGGAVRDTLLGHSVTERDWVVIGATPEEMLAKGFQQVGKSFPVFLHPETKEEYALARKERKTAKGYYGFECDFSPTVTLEEDLSRRDLTINAMAQAENGDIIDPFNGRQDLQNKVLRHVSSAFQEDPVRILRLARFLARFKHLGFSVHAETVTLMKKMVATGEVNALIPERIWKEMERALGKNHPEAFIQLLREVGALKLLLPEVDVLYGIPQRKEYHPEIDTGIHTEMVLKRAAELTECRETRFAALMHDLGKGATPKAEWPSHKGHEARGIPLIKNLCNRLKVPNNYRDLAVQVSKYHLHCHRAEELNPSTILKVFEGLDAFRRYERFEKFLIACKADAQGRLGSEDKPYPQLEFLIEAFKATQTVDVATIVKASGLTGEALKNAIHGARISAIKRHTSSE